MVNFYKLTFILLLLGGLFYGWVKLFNHPVKNYLDALEEATWEIKQYCKQEKLNPCDFHLEKSSAFNLDHWEFLFYSKKHRRTKYVTVWSSSEGFMGGFKE